ncbi:hypothetical protein HaLaN_28009, partial [Haematococcus lacustris]
VRPLLLQLPWPISSGANEPDGMPLGCYSGGQGLESVQLRRKSGQVWLKLRKAELLANHMVAMYSRQQMVQQASKKPEGCSAELFVLLHLPIQEGPDGGPILPITVVDNRLALTLTESGQVDMMIFRNALRCKPTSSQKRCLPQLFNDPSGSPWFASYLSPRYAEHLGGEEGIELMTGLKL